MKAAAVNQRLDELAKEIGQLDSSIVERERDALAVLGEERQCELMHELAALTRIALDKALREYFIVAEVARRGAVRRVA